MAKINSKASQQVISASNFVGCPIPFITVTNAHNDLCGAFKYILLCLRHCIPKTKNTLPTAYRLFVCLRQCYAGALVPLTHTCTVQKGARMLLKGARMLLKGARMLLRLRPTNREGNICPTNTKGNTAPTNTKGNIRPTNRERNSMAQGYA